MIVSLFGHRDAPMSVAQKLNEVLRSLITELDTVTFYVGNSGRFDSMARAALASLEKEYPRISVLIILSYMPSPNDKYDFDTLLPESAASSIPKYAISRRNEWIITQSNIVITYVNRSYGGAYNAKKKAIRCGKRIIEIS